MPTHIRQRIEETELAILSEYATKACESRGRNREEEPDPIRTCFQRDRDRILHSKSFRRLKRKTQVFIDPSGDHYRTRLTHTLEVAQIARTISRALRLNEDLTEAIALGHDVGHTPFGHAGEAAMDECLKKLDPSAKFRHYEQSLRVLTVLENEGSGLNLTFETLDGIGGHSKGRSDLSDYDGNNCPSLEAAVVRVADRVAYLNHDLDDAVRADWLRLEDLPVEIARLGESHGKRIGAMVFDLIENSFNTPSVRFSSGMLSALNTMKEYLFDHLYLEYPKRFPDIDKAKGVVRSLFNHYMENPEQMPGGFSGVQGAVDYISGMTDRYAISVYEELFLPTAWS
ncbi:MAG: deoxyguanosinetriphosphate triphosphohydrolase [Fimbriimonadales bacterium]|nr:deoxyguanosinetriphosphate triphosphohydrolase [Fimbriimonadales bacterium]